MQQAETRRVETTAPARGSAVSVVPPLRLSVDDCERARYRRAATFDGVIFIAVRSTRIYCRPVCPVRQPLSKNVRYYASAAAAEDDGFRPCLRCRPETAPFSPAWTARGRPSAGRSS